MSAAAADDDIELAAIPAGASALVTTGNGSLDISMPKYGKHDAVPANVALLMAVFERAGDEPEWVRSMIDWLLTKRRKAGVDVPLRH